MASSHLSVHTQGGDLNCSAQTFSFVFGLFSHNPPPFFLRSDRQPVENRYAVEPANDTITLIIPIASGRESSPPDAAILIFGLDVSTSVEAPEQIYRIRSNPPYSYHFDSSLSQPGVGQILQ